MKKEDESVKTGLDIRSQQEEKNTSQNAAPAPDTAPIDADDKIHEETSVPVNPHTEQDYDEIIHQLPDDSETSGLEDPDDKIHREGFDEDSLDQR